MLIAGQAQALKCSEPDVGKSFQAAMNAPGQHVILRGRFQFDPALMPGDVTTRGNPNLPPPTPIAADFTGQALEPDGFTRDLATSILLRPICLGPWCGRIEPDTDMMVFAQSRADGPLLVELGPCATWVFPDPTDAMLARMQDCTADPAACMDAGLAVVE
jgi:hypothetical protein